MNRFDILLLFGIAFAIFMFWYLDKELRRKIEFDSPLRHVIAVQVELQKEFLSEVLKLSDEEIMGASQMTRGIFLRLQIWKTHYAGDVAFYQKFGETPLKSQTIQEFPTTEDQFPITLSKHRLFGGTDDNGSFDFGPNSPEKLEVLLSHKAIIIRARDGRYQWDASGHCYKPRPSDLVIPIRESDLEEYVDTYGRDDPDWLMATGHERRYQHQGRWAWWSVFTVVPESLSWTTSKLDPSAVKPNDGELRP